MTTTTASVFRLPDLGEGLTEAALVQWLVQVGDEISTDQAVAEVETAKSVVELPSPFAGTVTALHGQAGETIAVGAPVLEVSSPAASSPHEGSPSAPEGSTPTHEGSRNAGSAGAESVLSDPSWEGADEAGDKPGAAEKEAYRAEERAGSADTKGSDASGSGNVLIGYGTTERSSSGRRRARAVPRSQPPAPVASAPVAHAPAPPAAEAAPRRTVAVRSPLVRRLARDLGVDVHTITGTGSDGAITRGDVLRAAVDGAVDGVAAPVESATPVPAPVASAVSPSDALAVTSREKLSPLRKAVSAKLTRSRSEIPEATVWVDVDATRLWELRAEMAAEGERAPSLTALIARFTLLALAEYPLLASRLSDDADEILSFDGINLGVAADTERGLLVPVIARAHELSIAELDAQLREIADAARSGRMPPERLRGSTFTLNNYGSLGVDGSAAIINHPDVAILGIGRMIERPWVVDGEIVARRIAQLSLVFDHRVCDGGYAAGFLRRVVELIEHPLRAYRRI
ncbi:dihydrolipoamide acetyltransferase family protein [Microbacterium esteraromaticum]|uniref:dihydrolipoamide acetyltransferase family protein n=1 Tax=Microbacterium esteraromaticum TaxID=57043 RepID=UPI002368577A|nr:dihydrolipoamide acetyltransferase family protein [Microbacterium esteraromaticum]WDH79637.1 dihydrolipoamide acetyltransferase family protein [Microbacterium esteraromaticum]